MVLATSTRRGPPSSHIPVRRTGDAQGLLRRPVTHAPAVESCAPNDGWRQLPLCPLLRPAAEQKHGPRGCEEREKQAGGCRVHAAPSRALTGRCGGHRGLQHASAQGPPFGVVREQRDAAEWGRWGVQWRRRLMLRTGTTHLPLLMEVAPVRSRCPCMCGGVQKKTDEGLFATAAAAAAAAAAAPAGDEGEGGCGDQGMTRDDGGT
jgi:hypothetical protein